MTFISLHLLLHLCWFNLQQHVHMYCYIAAAAPSDLFWASVSSETYLASYCSAVVYFLSTCHKTNYQYHASSLPHPLLYVYMPGALT